MNMRLGPKKAVRRRRRSKKAMLQRRNKWRRNELLLEKIVRLYTNRKPPTERAILLRVINILGLSLLVMVAAVLGSKANFAEIIDLGRELFQLLP